MKLKKKEQNIFQYITERKQKEIIQTPKEIVTEEKLRFLEL